MNIKYNQLCIRNAEKKDCEQLAVWWNDGTVMAHAGFPNGLGTSAAEIEKQIADDSDETRRRLIIEYNDVRIGEMSFYVFENHRYEIGKRHWKSCTEHAHRRIVPQGSQRYFS